MREFVQPPHPANLEPLHMLQLTKSDPNAGILGPIPSQLPLGPRPLQPPIVVQPPLMLGPPQLSQPAIIQPPLPQDGKWLPSHHEVSPHPVHMIQPTPANLGGGCVPVMKEEEPLFKSNVPLSSDFDISVLFPDSHPQVSPRTCTCIDVCCLWVYQKSHEHSQYVVLIMCTKFCKFSNHMCGSYSDQLELDSSFVEFL